LPIFLIYTITIRRSITPPSYVSIVFARSAFERKLLERKIMALLSLTIAARRSDNLRLNRSGLAHADAQIDLHIITDNYVDARIDDRMMWVVELKVTNGRTKGGICPNKRRQPEAI
jgi:hypothetical protein